MSEVTQVKELSEYTLEELDQLIEEHGSKAGAARFIGQKPTTFRDAYKRAQKEAEYDSVMAEDATGVEAVETVEDTSDLPAVVEPPNALDTMTTFVAPVVGIEEAEAQAIYERGLLQQEFGEVLKGFAAASYKATVGTVTEFAELVKRPASSVKQEAMIYTRLTSLKEKDQESLLLGVKDGVLTYTHFLRANPIKSDKDYVRVLKRAARQGQGSGWVGEQAVEWKRLNSDAPAIEDAPESSEEGGWNPDGEYQDLSREQLVAELQARDQEVDNVLTVEAPLVGGSDENEVFNAVVEVTTDDDRFVIHDDDNGLMLVDSESGEVVVPLSTVISPDTFAEFVKLANEGARA